MLQQSRLQRYMPSLEFSHISFPDDRARSKFLERERESLSVRFYPKKVAKMIRQTSPSVDVNNPSLLERRNEKTFALRVSSIARSRTAIALHRCFVSDHAQCVRILGVAARERSITQMRASKLLRRTRRRVTGRSLRGRIVNYAVSAVDRTNCRDLIVPS